MSESDPLDKTATHVLPTFAAREENALVLFDFHRRFKKHVHKKLFASFCMVDDFGNGEPVYSPIRIKGEVLDQTQNEEGQSIIKVLVWEEWAKVADLEWSPPHDFMPDADELDRLTSWHGTATENLTTSEFIREVKLGDIGNVMLSMR